MSASSYTSFIMNKFFNKTNQNLNHSAKGTTWEDHKYIKRIDGTYYYPDDYVGGRHLPDEEKESNKKEDTISKLEDITGMKKEELVNLWNLSREKGYDSAEFKELLSILSEGDAEQAKKMTNLLKEGQSSSNLSSDDVEKLAKEVIRGNFGNGQERKDLLGENYAEIQKRVDEILKGTSGSKKVSEATSESIKMAEEAAKKASASSSNSNIHSGVNIDEVLSVYKKK